MLANKVARFLQRPRSFYTVSISERSVSQSLVCPDLKIPDITRQLLLCLIIILSTACAALMTAMIAEQANWIDIFDFDVTISPDLVNKV